jgi:hypothetical protein
LWPEIDGWRRLPELNLQRVAATSAVIGDYIYVLGGFGETWESPCVERLSVVSLEGWQMYRNPALIDTTNITAMEQTQRRRGLHFASSCVIRGVWHVFGGGSRIAIIGSKYTSAHVSMLSNVHMVWIPLTEDNDSTQGTGTTTSAALSILADNNTDISAVTSSSSNTTTKDKIGPRQSWRLLEPLPIGLFQSTAVSVATSAYIIGGLTANADGQSFLPSDMMYRYDTKTSTWSTCARMNHARFGCRAVTCEYQGRPSIIVVGGLHSFPITRFLDPHVVTDIEYYDIEDDQWYIITNWSMPGVVIEFTCALMDDTLVIGSGYGAAAGTTWAINIHHKLPKWRRLTAPFEIAVESTCVTL